MSRYIDADLIRYDEDIPGVFIASKTRINNIPTADVRENVKGEWKCNIEWGYGTCSVCGRIFPIRNGNPKADRYNFCPNCGADMRSKS